MQPIAAPVAIDYRVLLRDTINSEMIEEQTNSAIVGFLDVISTLKDEVRLYYLNELTITNQIWPAFRAKEEVVDMLMRLSMNFNYRLSATGLQEHFKNAINGYMDLFGQDKSFTDEDFHGKLAKGASASSYPMWLKFVILCMVEYKAMLAAMQR